MELRAETLLHIRCGCKLRVVLAHPYVGQAVAELVGQVGLSVIVALVSIVLEVGGCYGAVDVPVLAEVRLVVDAASEHCLIADRVLLVIHALPL